MVSSPSGVLSDVHPFGVRWFGGRAYRKHMTHRKALAYVCHLTYGCVQRVTCLKNQRRTSQDCMKMCTTQRRTTERWAWSLARSAARPSPNPNTPPSLLRFISISSLLLCAQSLWQPRRGVDAHFVELRCPQHKGSIHCHVRVSLDTVSARTEECIGYL